MTVAAIIEPTSLLGNEMRQALGATVGTFTETRLLTLDASSVGAVTEIGDRAALVQEVSSESLAGVDLVFDCGSGASAPSLAEHVGEGSVTIWVDPPVPPSSSVPVVAGVNLDAALESNWIVSPDASTIMIAHLLAPLADLEVLRTEGHLMFPASARGQQALDELFNQTRAILAMNSERPETVFGAQLAFNLLPFSYDWELKASELARVLGHEVELSVDATQAGVFHSLSASLLIRVERKATPEEVLERLSQSPYLERSEEPTTLGPIDAASSDRVLFTSPVAFGPRGDSFRVRTVMDNLTRGGALNALGVAEYILTHRN